MQRVGPVRKRDPDEAVPEVLPGLCARARPGLALENHSVSSRSRAASRRTGATSKSRPSRNSRKILVTSEDAGF